MISLSLLLALHLASQAPGTPSITLDNGNTIQLCGSCSSRTVRVAVTARDLVLSDKELRPQVIEVRRGNVPQQQWRNWITATWETEKGVPVALILVVSDSLNQQGTYDVVLMVRSKMDRLKLQIVHPAAQLEVPEKLTIDRVQGLPLTALSVDLPLLTVRESTGLAKVSRLAFNNRKALLGEQGVSGRILPSGAEGNGDTPILAPGVEVPAGQPQAIPYALSGEFPYGTVTGVLQLSAPQLSQPVTLNYVVRTRLHTLWITIPIGMGLLLGWFIKVWLQNRIVLREAQRQAIAIIQLIDERLVRYDGTTRQAIDTARKDVETSARGTDPVKLTASAKELEKAWTEAVTAFEARYKAVIERRPELERLLGQSWRVPVAVAEPVEAARLAMGQVSKLLAERRADEASRAMDALSQTLAEEVRQKGLAWQKHAGELLHTLKAADRGIPETVRAQFEAEITSKPPELDRITSGTANPDPAQIRAALSDLADELMNYSALLESLGRRTDRAWLEFEATWKALPELPKPQTLADLKQSLDEFVRQVLVAGPAPKPLLDSLAGKLAALQDAWAKAILSQVADKGKEEERKAIQAQIVARQFVLAGTAMAALVEGTVPALGDGEAGSVPAPWVRTVAVSREGDLAWLPKTVHASDVIPGLPAVTVERDLRAAQVMQTMLVGLLMGVWAFSFYAKTFDGTCQGLLTPFFATLLFDLSVEGMKAKLNA